LSKIKKSQFIEGLTAGLPIGIGYFPVSFTFGIMAAEGGLNPLIAILMSFTNLTSAGQFAGMKLMFSIASYSAIIFATIIINLRYMLMSISISQKLAPNISIFKRLIFGFGITDETFAIATTRIEPLSDRFMFGLITLPIIGWTLGTAAGAFLSNLLPQSLQTAMGIGLYAMFIAIIIPPAKKQKSVLLAICLSIAFSCALTYIPFFKLLNNSLKPLIAACVSAVILALIAPRKEEQV
jgi:4-azaleucine resistance transporter AzlC